MFHSTIAVFLCCGFLLLILLRSAPPLIGCRPLLSLFCLSHPHGLPLPCALLGLPPRVVFSLPTSLLVTVLRGGIMSYLSWGFPYPPPPLPYSASAAFPPLPSTCHLWLLLLFLTSPLPCFVCRLLHPPCTRPFSLSLRLPPLVAFFLI